MEFAKSVSNVNLKTIANLGTTSISDVRLVSECACGGGCNTFLKTQTEIFPWQEVNQLLHFKFRLVNYQKYLSVPFSRIFVRKNFCSLLAKRMWWSLFLVKFNAFTIFFWSVKIILWDASYIRYLNNIQTTKVSLQTFLMEIN